jgi:hypothetical protein
MGKHEAGRARRARSACLLGALLGCLIVFGPSAWAVFAADTVNSGNSASAAAVFPTYPSEVTGDSPWAYYRSEESQSAAATRSAADSSGNGRTGTFDGTTNGPSTFWNFDENGGSHAADSSGAVNTGTLGGSAGWAAGYSGSGLSMNGTGQYVNGTGPAVPTNAGLTVTAWVNLAAVGGTDQAAVSQNGSQTAGFMLGLDHATGKWAFKMTNSDVASPTVKTEYSNSLATPGLWTHLAGVYDPTVNKIFLYVDGGVIGNATKTVNWNAGGALQAGRAMVSGGWGDYFNGRVDDVRVYSRVLSAAEISAMAGTLLTTSWDFPEGAGATTADTSPDGNTGTLNSAGWTAAGHTGNAVSLDGVNDSVTGATMAVDTYQSLSVAAWVYLTGKGSSHVALSEDGVNISGFVVGYDVAADRWSFAMPSSDSASPAGYSAALGTASPALNTWYHLVAVYDKPAQQLTLYVNGVAAGTAAFTTPWQVSGVLVAGRGTLSGGPINFWPGRIDGVRTFQRALSAADVTSLYNGTDPTVGFTEADMTLGVTGALQGPQQGLQSSTAAAFAGGTTAYGGTAMNNPTAFSVECWFKAWSTAGGGEIAGFHQTAPADGGLHDRQIYLDSGGRVTFAVRPAATLAVRSTAAYDDGNWHHVVGTLDPAAGLILYLDGTLVASDPTILTAGAYTGYWRWGGGDLTGMPNRPTSDHLTGSIDEVAIYPVALTAQEVAWHYHANH